MFLATRLGAAAPEPHLLKIVNELNATPYSIGMIGGKSDRALYFVAQVGDKYVYLDPHKVQMATDVQNVESQLHTYFTSDVLMCNINDIAPSVALGFYFKDCLELQTFYEHIMYLNDKFSTEFFIPLKDEMDTNYC